MALYVHTDQCPTTPWETRWASTFGTFRAHPFRFALSFWVWPAFARAVLFRSRLRGYGPTNGGMVGVSWQIRTIHRGNDLSFGRRHGFSFVNLCNDLLKTRNWWSGRYSQLEETLLPIRREGMFAVALSRLDYCCTIDCILVLLLVSWCMFSVVSISLVLGSTHRKFVNCQRLLRFETLLTMTSWMVIRQEHSIEDVLNSLIIHAYRRGDLLWTWTMSSQKTPYPSKTNPTTMLNVRVNNAESFRILTCHSCQL